MPSADQVPVISTHSTMRWHRWVVLIAGSTGSALRAVCPPNLHITPVVRRDLASDCFEILEYSNRLPHKRHTVRTPHLHFLGRNNPFCLIKIELFPLGMPEFSRPHKNKCQALRLKHMPTLLSHSMTIVDLLLFKMDIRT